MTISGSSGLIFPDGSGQETGIGRNRIINGAMVIDQRNAGASVTNTAGAVYTLDRWKIYGSQASKFTVQQNAGSVTPPVGFRNYLGVTSASAYTVGSGEEFEVYQLIEGFNTSDLGFGTANASTVTLSFWVRSSLTGTFGGALQNSASTRSYPFSYTISAANTWEQKSITIAGDTSGTWLGATNGIGIQVYFGLGQGSSMSNTAGAWATGNFNNATGATSVVGTNGATFYITGVQLEQNTSATPFERRLYNQELANCQRYYWQAATGANKELACGWYYNSTQVSLIMNMPVPMRTGPTISQTTGTDYYIIYRNNAGDGFNSLSIELADNTMVSLRNLTEVSGTAGQAGLVRTNNASSALGFTAEL